MLGIPHTHGPYSFRIEEWSPPGRHLYVLAHVLAIGPAVAAFEATLGWKPDQELRLRRDKNAVELTEVAGMNFWIAEWAGSRVAACHGLFLSPEPARAAFAAIAAVKSARELTLHHHGRVLERA